ncbi:MAG: phosphoribosylamine--glycine ligase [Alphaproteobacteria bacterium]|nr:phosphoribosylamine--glycine ligase [Alphaproteobacteria bacterium]MBL6937841.1 phosphoribosylamine--glycine ligase [Alphaproteobacteria bacterium]MBL7099333.1 phosphoribosylamine--glycine ligase [Alphaproteobacteria bacterium]
MKVLLVGSGGREHALAWALSASPLLTKLYCAPGNAGIAQVAECMPIPAMDFPALVAFAREKKIDFAVIGMDAPLIGGLWDAFEAAGIRATGPSKTAAVLEGSKGFVKDLCAEYGIPTAAYRRFAEPKAAKAFADTLGLPVVIKADGPALGKGVVVADTRADARKAIDFVFDGGFGEGAPQVVVEEFMAGEEGSFFALSDGTHVIPLAGAQDHKQVFDGDKGPNTGGMGAYSPAPVLTPAMEAVAMETFIKPTVAAMRARGRTYAGAMYLGLIFTAQGPKLVEYNCRFGDPETQVLMPRLKSDLLTVLLAMRDGILNEVDLRWSDEVALTVVMASGGYPGAYTKGHVIHGLGAAAKLPGVQIFHAGTERRGGDYVTAGGRVLNVTATGKTVAEAQARAYAAVDLIHWEGSFARRDIGWRALART